MKLKTTTILLLILLMGLSLRLYNINTKSYWLDEETSIIFANKELNELIKNAETETHPPFYYLILKFWINLFGESETATRSLSVLFGVISIFMMYKISCLLFSKKVGLISSLILSISAFHIKYSQETRMYSLMVMLAITSMYFFIKTTQEKTFKTATYYIISSIFLLYSHMYGLFIIIAQNIYVLTMLLSSKLQGKIKLKKWIIIQSVIIIFFIPWIIILFKQLTRTATGEFGNIIWLTKPTITSLFMTLLNYTYYNSITIILLFILALISVRSGIKDNYLLILWFLTPILLPFLISFITPIYHAKYTIAASVAFYLLASNGISKIKNKKVSITVISSIIILSLISTVLYYQEDELEPWKDIANYIDKKAEKNDLIIVIPHYARHNLERYTAREDIKIIGKRNIISSDPDRIWFVVRYEEFDEDIEGYSLIEDEEYGKLTVYFFKKP